MDISARDFTSAYLLVMDLVLGCSFLWLFKKSGASSAFLVVTGLGLAAWLGGLHWGISGQWLLPADISGFGFLAVVLTVAAAAIIPTSLTPPFKKYMLQAPQQRLMLLIGIRGLFGVGFVVEAVLGIMPRAFGIWDGTTHILAAFLALRAAVLIQKGSRERGNVWFANLFGLLDIVGVALGISFVLLREITPYHNSMYAVFFAAPLFLSLHFVSLTKLATSQKGVD